MADWADRLDRMDGRLDRMDGRLDRLETDVAGLRENMDRRFDRMEGDISHIKGSYNEQKTAGRSRQSPMTLGWNTSGPSPRRS